MNAKSRADPLTPRPPPNPGAAPARTFEFDGEKYRQASAHQKEWGLKLIDQLELNGSERILDLGCGDAVLTSRLALRVPKGSVLGIDSSPSMIAIAAQLTQPNLAFALRDINQIDYREEFDVIFSNSALHWVKDHRGLLPRLLAALKPGGFVRFNFPARSNSANFNRIVRQVMADPTYASGFRGFEWPWYMPRPKDYQRLVERFPCREVQVYGENADRFFPDPEAMIRWLDQPCLVPFLPCVEPAKREGFRAQVIDRMLQACLTPDHRCFEKFRRVHVFFRK